MKPWSRQAILAGILAVRFFFSDHQAWAEPAVPLIFGAPGTSSGKLDDPVGAAVDSSGRIYVADTDNDRILVFTSTGGHVFTIGTSGTSNGEFSNPKAVAVDYNSGVIYVADTGNVRIQKFSSSRVYSAQADGSTCGSGAFSSPNGVTVDASGNVYVTDGGNNGRVVIFNSSLTCSSIFGSLGTTSGKFTNPQGVSIDSSTQIYVADTGNNRVQVFSSTGGYLNAWGTSGNGDSQFSGPVGVAVDTTTNKVYVSDLGNARILQFTVSTGGYLSQWGSSGTLQGQFVSVLGLAVNPASSTVVAVDHALSRVQVFNPSSVAPAQSIPPRLYGIWGQSGTGNGQFRIVRGLAVGGDGSLWVTDTEDRVQNFSSSGVYTRAFGSNGTDSGQFSDPWGVAVYGSTSIFVSDTSNHRVQKLGRDGTHECTMAGNGQGSSSNQMDNPAAVAVSATGVIYVVDSNNGRISTWSQNCSVISYSLISGLNYPKGMALDSSHNIYVADTNNHVVRKYNSGGTLQATWGTSGRTGGGQGQFDYPYGVTIDSSNYIYVTEVGNDRVQKFDTDGNFLAMWGTYGSGGSQAEFSDPYAIAVSTISGDLFVADTSNYRIQRYSSTSPYNSTGGSGTSVPYVAALWGDGQETATWGSTTSAIGQFYDPRGVAVSMNGQYVYVSEYSNHRIQAFTSSGTFVGVWGSSGTASCSGMSTNPGCLLNPSQIAVDASGFVYVTDNNNHRIQKFDAFGNYNSLWGSNGATTGKFDNPWGIAIDTTTGWVYVADTDNHRIQKFESNGTFLTTWGSYGTAQGLLNYPYGLAVDGAGNLYVADRNNHRIQKFSPSGVVLSAWGSYGTIGNGKFNYPEGVTVDRNNNVYVVDYNDRVQKFDANGTYLTEWGSDGSGQENFEDPSAIAVDLLGNVYVAEIGNDRVKRYSPNAPANSSGGSGTSTPYLNAVWGNVKQATWGSPLSANGQFYDPISVAADRLGNIYVSEYSNQRIQKFDSSGTFVAAFSSSGTADGFFSYPAQIAVDANGYGYVADNGNHRVQKFDLNNNFFVMSWGSNGSAAGKFDNPWGIAVDTTTGWVYVSDTDNHRIQKFTSSGTFLLTWGGYGSAVGKFNYPYGLAVDGAGFVYSVDRNNHRIQKFTPYGVAVSTWGSYSATSGNGAFYYPEGIAVDKDFNVYVGDLGDQVQKFSATGSFLAQWGGNGSAQNYFEDPIGIGVDNQGNIFIAEKGNDRVNRFSASALTNVSGGSGSTAPSLNLLFGVSGTAMGTLSYPKGVAVDSSGFIYVADTSNHRIQKFTSSGSVSAVWGSTTASSSNGYFSSPRSVAVSTAGWAYVADTGNNRVQVFDTNGVYLGSWGSSGSESGKFSSPYAVSLDTTTGHVYVLDGANYHIQKFSSSGTFLMSWGAYGTGAGLLSSYSGGALAVDGSGSVYLTDYSNHRIQKFSPFGVVLSTWGASGSSAGYFSYPNGVVVDRDNNVYVADTNNSRIQKFGSTGNYLTSWGSNGSGQELFSTPSGLAVDGAGNVYVADSNNNRIKRYGSALTNSYGGGGVSTPVVTAIWGSEGASTGTFSSPWGIAVDSATGHVYVADTGNARIQKFTSGGNYLTSWISSTTNLIFSNDSVFSADGLNSKINVYDSSGSLRLSLDSGRFSNPYGVAVDSASGVMYVSDSGNTRIQKLTSSGTFVSAWGGSGGAMGLLGSPRQMAVDAAGNIYVVDSYYHQVQKFSPYGVALSTWGGSGAGNGQFSSPQGIAVDALGNVYVADTNNHRIQKFNANGTYLASWGQSGSGPNDLSYPRGLTVTADGTNLYVAEYGNNRVKRYSLYQLGLAPYVTGVTSSTVRLEWTAATSSSFTVAAARDLGFASVISSGTVYSTSTVVLGLSELTTYYFMVKFSSDTDSYYNTPIVTMTSRGDTTAPSGQPSTPTDDGVFVGTTSLSFYWGAGSAVDSESGISGYYLRVFTSTVGFIYQGNVGSTTSYTLTGVSSGTYYASVQAINGTGFYSAYSSTSNGISVELTAPSGTPAVPTDAGSFVNSTATLTFSWTQGSSTDPESGIDGYYLQIGTGSGSTSIFDGYLGNALSTTVATSLTEGTTYFARVRARNGASLYGDYSSYSDGVNVDLTLPGAPSGISSDSHPSSTTAYPSTTGSFSVSTANVSDASGIVGFYWVVAASTASTPTASSGTYASSSSISVTSLQADGTWYFLAVSVDGAGNVGTSASWYKFKVKVSVDPNSDNTFTNSDGVIVEIPAGAVTSSTTISIAVSTAPSIPQDSLLRATGVIRDIKLTNGTKNFSRNVTVTLPYTSSDVTGLTESSLKLFFYDETERYWALIPNSSVNTTSRTVTGIVDHFTIFQILQYSTPAEALSGISNYPNPFSPLKSQSTRIRYTLDADQDVTIKIFDAYGSLVWEDEFASGASGGRNGPNEVTWDGKTPDGRYVAADAYICLINAGGLKGKRIIGVK